MIDEKMKRITCLAPSNMAVIKYWGKRDEKLILPINDSISVTLSVDLMHAKTTICASPRFTKNKIWLNGVEQTFDGNQRLISCFEELRNRARKAGDGCSDGIYDWNIHICSENNFPTAAGLASSAAGYACLVYALGNLYGLADDLSGLARRGSGSACRSLNGGFVRWHKGEKPDGSDSIASQVASNTHWPDLRVLIIIVRKTKKETSSTSGMSRSSATSELLPSRALIVPSRIDKMIEAIKSRDFATFAEITMKDSNQFHAICLDTYPPAVYMTDISHTLAALVHAFNTACGATRLAYTFDAGPNASLFFERENAPLVLALINHYFSKASENFKGDPIAHIDLPADLSNLPIEKQQAGVIKGMIYSEVGDGPKILPDENSLLGNDGLPLSISE